MTKPLIGIIVTMIEDDASDAAKKEMIEAGLGPILVGDRNFAIELYQSGLVHRMVILCDKLIGDFALDPNNQTTVVRPAPQATAAT